MTHDTYYYDLNYLRLLKFEVTRYDLQDVSNVNSRYVPPTPRNCSGGPKTMELDPSPSVTGGGGPGLITLSSAVALQ